MTVDYITLRDEIANDPQALGYTGKTNKQIRDLLNGLTQPFKHKTISGSDLLDLTDWRSNGGYRDDTIMTGNKRLEWITFTSKEAIDLDKSCFQVIRSIFGGSAATPSVTEANVDAARNVSVSRATILGLGVISTSDVKFAKTGGY